MSRTYRLAPRAQADVEDIFRYIADDDLEAALRVDQEIDEACLLLSCPSPDGPHPRRSRTWTAVSRLADLLLLDHLPSGLRPARDCARLARCPEIPFPVALFTSGAGGRNAQDDLWNEIDQAARDEALERRNRPERNSRAETPRRQEQRGDSGERVWKLVRAAVENAANRHSSLAFLAAWRENSCWSRSSSDPLT